MSHGHITVGGFAGMSAGAAMIDGLIHVKGDCGPRCGVAMKGGAIVVEGKIGYQSGFMARAGRITAIGGAGPSCADALWLDDRFHENCRNRAIHFRLSDSHLGGVFRN